MTINLTQSIEGATKYKWELDNNTVIAEGTFDEANEIVLSSSTVPELNDEYESSHSLTLYIMINGIEYSGTLRFFYSDSSATTNVEITGIHTEDNNARIIYGTAETFIADFKDNISGNVRWSSSNPDILYIDPVSGIAEAKTKGKVDITATLIANESETFTLNNVESYIPATGISFSSNEKILILQKDGIEINSSNYINFTCLPIISTPSSDISVEDLSSKPIFTLSNNNGVISIDENNIVQPLSGGKETIKASIDGYETSIDIYVWDIDVVDGDDIVTNKDYYIHPITNTTLSLRFNDGYFNQESFNNSDVFSCVWCFDGIENKKYYDEKASIGETGHVEIVEENNFSAVFYRTLTVTPEPKTTALIKEKDTTIATISFVLRH